MHKTIEGLPEFLTRAQYIAMFSSFGIDPANVLELRLASDGVHAVVFALDANGKRMVDMQHDGYYKHRVFIPVRREPGDRQRTRVRVYIGEHPEPLKDPQNLRGATAPTCEHKDTVDEKTYDDTRARVICVDCGASWTEVDA